MAARQKAELSADGHVAPDATATARAERAAANRLLGGGLGIGAFGALSGALLGAVCPLCVVAAPALVGAGIYEHIRASRRRKAADTGCRERAQGHLTTSDGNVTAGAPPAARRPP